ncbi:rhodanese-like domain-containing protein [Streptococcus henryi]|uniref:rhodanese-like domain-containing protein n=1 Tax=Streptococcus henryi TaxID=439219 RepID=UPI00037F5984
MNFLKRFFSSAIKSISSKELEELLAKEKITLLDVRTKQEYQGGHIKGARNFPLDQLEAYKEPKVGPLYVICQSGMRSKRAASLLSKKGYQVINVRGGMSAYTGKIIGGK